MTRASFFKREAAEYMTKTDMMPMERQELLDWIKDGNSVYDNPWLIAEEDGHLMDYVSAKRAADELRARYEAQGNHDLINVPLDEFFEI